MWSVIVALVELTVCRATIVDVKRACGLSDDDALNFFFKKTLFAPAFPQMKVTTTTAEKFSVLMAGQTRYSCFYHFRWSFCITPDNNWCVVCLCRIVLLHRVLLHSVVMHRILLCLLLMHRILMCFVLFDAPHVDARILTCAAFFDVCRILMCASF